MENRKTPGGQLKVSRCKMLMDEVLNNLLTAQKNMASAETTDAKGLILLSRFILHVLKQLDDEVINLCSEAEEKRS